FRAPGGGNAASLPEGRTFVSTARGHFQQVLDEARKIEIDVIDARWAAELRLARQKFTFVDKGFKSFDSRAAARTDIDPIVLAGRQALEKRARRALRGLDAAAKARDLAAVQAVGKTADDLRAELEKLNLTFGP